MRRKNLFIVLFLTCFTTATFSGYGQSSPMTEDEKWAFVEKKLGPSSMLMSLLSIPVKAAGALGVYRGAAELAERLEYTEVHSGPKDVYLGFMSGILGYKLMGILGGSISNAWSVFWFLLHWPVYKEKTPEELHAYFDAAYQRFIESKLGFLFQETKFMVKTVDAAITVHRTPSIVA